MRSERDGSDALRASSPPVAEAMCPVLSDPAARREYQRQAQQWREQAFRRSTGLQPRTGLSVFSASKPSNPAFAKSVSPAMASTAHAVSTAVLASVAASASSSTGSARMVPLFPSASDARGRQGFARVINHSEEAGEVEIEAFDDEGMSYGPLTLTIDAGETVHFNSNDLEEGNANKGLTGNTGSGQGDWRLDVLKRTGHRGAVVHPDHGRVPDGDARHGSGCGRPSRGGDLQPREQRGTRRACCGW